jgi:hypothetical protein
MTKPEEAPMRESLRSMAEALLRGLEARWETPRLLVCLEAHLEVVVPLEAEYHRVAAEAWFSALQAGRHAGSRSRRGQETAV